MGCGVGVGVGVGFGAGVGVGTGAGVGGLGVGAGGVGVGFGLGFGAGVGFGFERGVDTGCDTTVGSAAGRAVLEVPVEPDVGCVRCGFVGTRRCVRGLEAASPAGVATPCPPVGVGRCEGMMMGGS